MAERHYSSVLSIIGADFPGGATSGWIAGTPLACNHQSQLRCVRRCAVG